MPREYVPVALKQQVFDRAQGNCEYCCSQSKFSPTNFVIEHITPVSRGGETTADNLALACQSCNNYKYNKTQAIDPMANQLVSLYHPRQMQWAAHFTWSDATTLMLGITPTGRATVELLRVNREGVINLRQILRDRGQHPPRQLKGGKQTDD